MNFIAWIILGGIAGWIASKIAKTDKSQGILLNIIVGIIGAGVGGFLMNMIGGEGVTGFNLYSLLVAVAGAVIALSVFKAVTGRKTA